MSDSDNGSRLWEYVPDALKVVLAIVGTWAASQLSSLNSHVGDLNRQLGVLVERLSNQGEALRDVKNTQIQLEQRIRAIESEPNRR